MTDPDIVRTRIQILDIAHSILNSRAAFPTATPHRAPSSDEVIEVAKKISHFVFEGT